MDDMRTAQLLMFLVVFGKGMVFALALVALRALWRRLRGPKRSSVSPPHADSRLFRANPHAGDSTSSPEAH